MGEPPAIDHPRGFMSPISMAMAELDFAVGESGAPGRPIVFRNRGGGRFSPHLIVASVAAERVHAVDGHADGRPGLITIGRTLFRGGRTRPSDRELHREVSDVVIRRMGPLYAPQQAQDVARRAFRPDRRQRIFG